MNKETKNYRFLGADRLMMEPSDNTGGIENRDIQPRKYQDILNGDPNRKLVFHMRRTELLAYFGVSSLNDIYPTLVGASEEEESELRQSVVERWTSTYGEFGTPAERKAAVNQAMHVANQAISTFTDADHGILTDYKESFSALNEIETTNDPLKLVYYMFAPTASRRLRYEARRKLILADLALQASEMRDKSIAEMGLIVDFMNEALLTNGMMGKLSPYDFVAIHEKDEFECVDICSDEDFTLEKYKGHYAVKHRFQMRDVHSGDKIIPVMMDHRAKSDSSRILKMMRKDSRNPNVIEDELGIKMVFQSKADIYDFVDVLVSRAIENGSGVSITDVSDTIENEVDYDGSSSGSSKKIEMIKYLFHWNNVTVELQFFTVKGYLDAEYRHEVSHEEFGLVRNMDVIPMLFPCDVYGEYDVEEIQKSLVHRMRREKVLRAKVIE